MSIQRRSDELVDLLRPDFVGNDGTASPSFVWVCVAAGTAAAPGFRFCADPDTGFYRRGANEIGIATQGIIRGYWGPGLNIGTATGAPGGRVRIGAGTPNLRLCDTNAGSDQAVNGLIEFYRGVATNRVAYVAMDSLTNDIFAIATEYANGEIRLRTGNGVDAVIIDKNQDMAVTGGLTTAGDIATIGAGYAFKGGAWISNVASTGAALFGGGDVGFYTVAGGILQFRSTGVDIMQLTSTALAVGGVPVASTILTLSSTTGALLLPRMTTAQRNALAPTNGMMVYDTTVGAIYAREAGAWVNL